MMTDYRSILKKIINKCCTPEELAQFMELFATPEGERLAHELIGEVMAERGEGASADTIPAFSGRQLKFILGLEEKAVQKPARLPRTWISVVAASFVLAMAWWYSKYAGVPQGSTRTIYASLQKSNQPLLTIENGRSIELSTEKEELVVADDKLTYADHSMVMPADNMVAQATLTTPHGKVYRMRLPDGSQVWLNAASSLRFPSRFTGAERKVELQGEAYFEISTQAKMPFVVKLNDETEVQVLGTSFNVHADNHAGTVKTTLVNGSVIMRSNRHEQKLLPGQQAITTRQVIRLTTDVDMEQELAWRQDMFIFNGATIQTIMEQAAQWYGVDVQFTDAVDALLVARIPRKVDLPEFLELLKLTKKVDFRASGRKVIVSSHL